MTQFVTTEYIEKALYVSIGTAARWIREGKIKEVYRTSKNGNYRIPKNIADQFIESCKIEIKINQDLQ